MAGADASIYGMIRPQVSVRLEDPDEIQAKRLSVRNLMQQGEMKGLELEEARRGAATSRRLQDFFSANPNATPDQISAIDYKAAEALRKSQLEAEAKRAAIKKDTSAASASDFTTQVKKLEHGAALLDVARDQASYDMALQIGRAAGIFPADAQFPAQFSPEAVKALQNAGMTRAQQLLDERARQTAAETGRHNLVIEANSAGQLRVAQGNLAETRANNAKPVFDPVRGVFATRPDAKTGASAVITPQGMPQSPQQVQSLREDTDKLRQEFEAKPSVKNYRDVIPIAAAGRNAPDTRSGDIQMAYAVGKILDPNSVVREGELKLVGDAATVMGKIEGELRTVAMGKGRLNPETRAQLNAMLSNAVEQRKASYEAEKVSYGGIVQRRGYKPEDVFIDVPEDRRAQPAPAAAETKVVNGKTYVKQNGQWYERN